MLWVNLDGDALFVRLVLRQLHLRVRTLPEQSNDLILAQFFLSYLILLPLRQLLFFPFFLDLSLFLVAEIESVLVVVIHIIRAVAVSLEHFDVLEVVENERILLPRLLRGLAPLSVLLVVVLHAFPVGHRPFPLL